ncbi:hypothetical protein ACTXM3_18135 [Glutamicibacter arilaitensis]|uniref:hypothetical protein n=1 Tax=Glutamicibacter arilaitensis TaxID=256701 RepID=UPI003FD59E31
MPEQYTPEVKNRAVAYAMERLDRYKSVYAAGADMAPKLRNPAPLGPPSPNRCR